MGLFNRLVVDTDLEWGFIDGSIVKARQYNSDTVWVQKSAIEKSDAEYTTKTHMPVDS